MLPAPWSYLAVAGGAAVEAGESLFWIRWSRRRRTITGAEGLLGAEAVVVAPCRPMGQVRVHGELWQARCERSAEAGETVRVERVEGLTLIVE